MSRRRQPWFTGLLSVAVLCFASANASANLFADSFEPAFNAPATEAEAVRFLNQATFGATPQDISAVRSRSIAIWLNAQLNHPTVTLSRPWLEAYAAALPSGSVNQDARIHRWFDVAVTAPDQVRQRVAYALSQIVVASDRDDFLSGRPIQMAEWNDILVRHALGNYRDLLHEVTFSPMMGRYLTHLRNRKFELNRSTSGGDITFSAGNNGVQPDENYAREIMQLFSIGLLVRDEDFYTTFDDPQAPGQLLTTYDETNISELARFFTGLSYQCTQGTSVVGGVPISRNCGPQNSACTGIGCRFSNSGLFFNNPPRDSLDRGLDHPDWYKPMVCYPRYHDNGRDTSGAEIETDTGSFSLPPGTPAPEKRLSLGSSNGVEELVVPPSFLDGAPLNCHRTTGSGALNPAQQQACVDYCEGSVSAVVDLLFNHPNTPPMLARQLIQRLVTSNPSPAYVQRVAEAFIDNGAGVRGDMKAVVRAILTDIEARRPANDAQQPVDFGKAREPMLKLVALWRHFGAESGDTGTFPNQNPRGGNANPLAGQPSLRRWGPTNPQNEYQQRPLGAPTVFNFFEPDYAQPGPVADRGLFSPELQIIHEVTAVATANDLFSRLCSGYGGGSNNCSSGRLTGGPSNTPPNNRAYFPEAMLNQIPARLSDRSSTEQPTVAEDAALIEFMNTRIMGGTMSGTLPASIDCGSGATGTGMKGTLMALLQCPGGINATLNGGSNGTSGGNREERQRRKALYLMHLIAISPEYSTQR